MNKFVNLTPHEIVFILGEKKISIPPSGKVARAVATEEKIGEVNGVPVYKTVLGKIEGLPPFDGDSAFIVSRVVAEKVRGKRLDVFVPTKSVRDKNGVIIGCEGLGHI